MIKILLVFTQTANNWKKEKKKKSDYITKYLPGSFVWEGEDLIIPLLANFAARAFGKGIIPKKIFLK